MQIVINIPKDIYEDIMVHNREMREGGKSAYYFEGVIQNGTVLPEHGRLIDANEIRITNYEIFTNDFKESLKLLIERIRNAPTILEGTMKV